jgi:hypothetical protein
MDLNIPQRGTSFQLSIQLIRQIRHPHRHQNTLPKRKRLICLSPPLLRTLLQRPIAKLERWFRRIPRRIVVDLERRKEVSVIEDIIIVPIQRGTSTHESVEQIRSRDQRIQYKQPRKRVSIQRISIERCTRECLLFYPGSQYGVNEGYEVVCVGRHAWLRSRSAVSAYGRLHVVAAGGAPGRVGNGGWVADGDDYGVGLGKFDRAAAADGFCGG